MYLTIAKLMIALTIAKIMPFETHKVNDIVIPSYEMTLWEIHIRYRMCCSIPQ